MIMGRDGKPSHGRPGPEGQAGWLQSQTAGQTFASEEKSLGFPGQAAASRGDRLPEELQGLSSAMMRQFLCQPFDSPGAADFRPPPPAAAEVPFMRLYRLLAEALRGNGVKATARGNLPRSLCREAALAYWGPEKYADIIRYGGINNEVDFMPLGMVRHTADGAGMIRLDKGRWKLAENGLASLESGGLTGAFPRLFRMYAERINWSVQDNFPEAFRLQGTFLFTLYLLARHGAGWRMDSFYANLFLAAFPALPEFESGHYREDPARWFRLCYSIRVLERFAAFWGLAETEEVFEEREGGVKFPAGRRVRLLPLLADLIAFPKA